MTDLKTAHEAWKFMTRVYHHLRHAGAHIESILIADKLTRELFEDMFKEAA